MGIWLVFCLVSPCIAGSVTQQGETGIDGRGCAIITAASERVEVGNDFARTDIACNTDNGSKGSGFVTANAQPPIFVASGNQGNRVIPRIRERAFSACSETLNGGRYFPQ